MVSKFFKDVNIALFVVCNVLWCTLVFALQFLRYEFLPSVAPAISVNGQHAEAVRYMLKTGTMVTIEIIVWLSILLLVNKFIIFKDWKRALTIAMLEITILTLSTMMYSIQYINKFPG